MTVWHTSYIALGSNLKSPVCQLQRAIQTLQQQDKIRQLRYSSFYQSKAMVLDDNEVQPDYINAVVSLETQLSPLKLLSCLQNIEHHQGRERSKKWAARTLDLDILLYADQTFQSAELTIPHPGLLQRNFVVYPLYELAGEMQIDGYSLAQIRQQLGTKGLTRLNYKEIPICD